MNSEAPLHVNSPRYHGERHRRGQTCPTSSDQFVSFDSTVNNSAINTQHVRTPMSPLSSDEDKGKQELALMEGDSPLEIVTMPIVCDISPKPVGDRLHSSPNAPARKAHLLSSQRDEDKLPAMDYLSRESSDGTDSGASFDNISWLSSLDEFDMWNKDLTISFDPASVDLVSDVYTGEDCLHDDNSRQSSFETSLSGFDNLPQISTGLASPVPSWTARDTILCNCYTTIVQRLNDLTENQLRGPAAFDRIIQLDRDIREQVESILHCRSCLDIRPRLFRLLGVIMEMMIDIFDSICFGEEEKEDGSACCSRSQQIDPSRELNEQHQQGENPSETHVSLINETSLQLGTYQFDGREKVDFLRYVAQKRLRELSDTIRRILHFIIQHQRVTCIFRAEAVMIMEIYRRLEGVISKFKE